MHTCQTELTKDVKLGLTVRENKPVVVGRRCSLAVRLLAVVDVDLNAVNTVCLMLDRGLLGALHARGVAPLTVQRRQGLQEGALAGRADDLAAVGVEDHVRLTAAVRNLALGADAAAVGARGQVGDAILIVDGNPQRVLVDGEDDHSRQK